MRGRNVSFRKQFFSLKITRLLDLLDYLQEMRELIKQIDHTLTFLSVYSPIMNPIDEVFLKIKFSARNLLGDPTNCLNLEYVMLSRLQPSLVQIVINNI